MPRQYLGGFVRREALRDATEIELHSGRCQPDGVPLLVEFEFVRTDERARRSHARGLGQLADTPRVAPQHAQRADGDVEGAAAVTRDPLRHAENAEQILADLDGPPPACRETRISSLESR